MSLSETSDETPKKPKGVWKPGKQPGAGRPKGSLSKRTRILRQIADNAVKKGRSPLDIMLKNMRFYDEKAESLLSNLEARIIDKKTAPLELVQLLQEMSGFRMSAQKCACDAAPFVHPKLSAIAVKVDDRPMQAKAEDQMSKDELSQYYNQLRLRPTSVTPLVIDNETGEQVHAENEEVDG